MKQLALAIFFMLSLCAYAGDRECIAKAIFKEANTEPPEGQRAVLDVILSRMHKRHKTACGVVKERGQFTWNVQDMHVTRAMLTTYENVRTMAPVAEGYDYFYLKTLKHRPRWTRHTKCKLIVARHVFCKLKEQA